MAATVLGVVHCWLMVVTVLGVVHCWWVLMRWTAVCCAAVVTMRI